MGNTANVIYGPAQLFIAPAGTAQPTLTGSATNFAAFAQPGFTDDGIEFDYTATIKDVMVDELTSPAAVILTAEKLVITAKLAEATLQNLFYAIAGAVQVSTTHLTTGGLTAPNEFMLGVMGPAPTTNKTRQILVYRTIQKAAVKMHFQRKDKVIFNCQFEALADSTKTLGANLCNIQDF